MEQLRLPVVLPIGYAQTQTDQGSASTLITRYLEHSIPYRSLFMRSSLTRYREHLLDAMASLLVQLHLAGIFWGDCSLSNTYTGGMLEPCKPIWWMQRRPNHPNHLPPTLRYHDLEIMGDNVDGDLADMEATGALSEGIPVSGYRVYIRLRYQRLWEEITHEEFISPGECYRIEARPCLERPGLLGRRHPAAPDG
jgi:hypothetical protein